MQCPWNGKGGPHGWSSMNKGEELEMNSQRPYLLSLVDYLESFGSQSDTARKALQRFDERSNLIGLRFIRRTLVPELRIECRGTRVKIRQSGGYCNRPEWHSGFLDRLEVN